MTRSDIPNFISVFRIVLVLPIVWLMAIRSFGAALVLFFVAGLSDALDGYLAKRNHWESRLGSIIDPLADKILLVSSYVVLAWIQLLPVWLMAIVILRDIVIVIGGLIYHYAVGRFDMQPSIISKLNTFLQILLVITVVFSAGVKGLDDWAIEALIAMVAFTTVLSGLHYVYVWSKRVPDAKISDNKS